MLDIRKALVLGLLLAGLLATGACAKATRVHATSGPSPALFTRMEYQATPATLRTDARRYSVIVMWSDAARYVADLHRLNPRLRILMYQNVPFSTVGDPTGAMDCTTVAQDMAHPGWLARTAGGAPIVLGTNYATDIGNSSFQQACISHAIALAKQGGFNGIFLDGMDEQLHDWPSGFDAHAAAFPTDAAWQSDMYSLLTYAGQTVHANGLLLFGNICGGVSSLWKKWNGPLDGAMEESWTDAGFGAAQQAPWWKSKLDAVAWSEAHGKYVLLHTYNSSEAANAYALASMLLVADGHTTLTPNNRSYTSVPTWRGEYTTAKRLGRALGGYRILRGGVYERRFAHGIVLVNPSPSRARRVSLGGRYSGSRLRGVRGVDLRPLSGLILTRAG